MMNKLVENYIKNHFKNYTDKDLRDFLLHGLYCEKISKMLFSNMMNLDFFNEEEKKLYKKYEKILYIGANFHDMGNFIPGGKPHNKKGGKFILKNRINELSEEENLIAANLVRFHRGKSPKDKNKMFSLLNEDLKKVVSFYSGILRIADALDFGHCEILEQVSLKDDKENKILNLYLDCNISANEGFRLIFKKKSKLLRKIIGRKIQILSV